MEYHHTPFALVVGDLLFLPSPSSRNVASYRALFSKLHADIDFCQTAFGDHFPPRTWTDDEVKEIGDRDTKLRWQVRGMGDFALADIPSVYKFLVDDLRPGWRKLSENEVVDTCVVEGEELAKLEAMDEGKFLENLRWLGYVCVRDATTCTGEPMKGDNLPPWQEMIELRYGLSAESRGRGVVTRGMTAVMYWAVKERGARRFIAESMKHNEKSGNVLRRLGLTVSDTKYWEYDELEWQSPVFENGEELRNHIGRYLSSTKS
ncbi:hypothetical protein VHEMI02007 [[Torrubiella] hemipterigena]|uniref:N-acetyltransferase domain-containing protein n=1 Tax=[Torrubiella] hemipterigena TaxID=1531966 RepID=A0A0A1SNE7_9HYPO|nr:hypothetical protein VHEMI02007 [[Torrubiella] hemipterigena]